MTFFAISLLCVLNLRTQTPIAAPVDTKAAKRVPVKIPYLNTAPIIDGDLSDDIWRQAAVFREFVQTSPGDNIAATKQTTVYIGYNERFLYLAFHCVDDPTKIRATLAKRDDVFTDDNVRIYLDTYDDRRHAYVLGFNPFGIQQDGIFTEGVGTDFSVDIVMESKGTVVSDGWVVEAKVPFKSLRYAAGKGKRWGIQLERVVHRFNDEVDSWMPIDRNNSSFLAQVGRIVGLDNIKTDRSVEVIPSITTSRTGKRIRTIPISQLTAASIDPGRFLIRGIKTDVGLNLKLNLTPNITFAAAINPDFAEIEADAPVVTANQRFPIYFEEKRPFFLEGTDIFQSPIQVFYSRNVVDPDYAAKITGKVGKNSFGFLLASDNAPGNYSDEERQDPTIQRQIGEFLDRNAFVAVSRFKRDVGQESSIGIFSTSRVFPKQRNFTGGFDGRLKLDKKLTFSFQAVSTTSRRCFFEPDFDPSREQLQNQRNVQICGDEFNSYRTGQGFGYYSSLDYTEKNRGFYLETSGYTRDYGADVGFTSRTNTNTIFSSSRLSSEPRPKARLVRVDWMLFSRFGYDWQGRSQQAFLGSFFGFTLQRNTFFNVAGGATYERLFEEEFGLHRIPSRSFGAFYGAPERSAYQPYVTSFFRSAPRKEISVYVSVGQYWNTFDYDFGAGNRFPRVSPAYLAYLASPGYTAYLRRRADNPADPDNYAPAAPALDPGVGTSVYFNAGGEYKPSGSLRLALDYTKSRLRRSDTRLLAFDTDIVSLRSTYQFSRFTFIRARLDYDRLSANIRGQVLFGYSPHPGTALYVGYNDDLNYNGFSPFTGQLEPNFTRNSAAFFVRASYLFRRSF